MYAEPHRLEERQKPLLVGELNPYHGDPRFALYCEPPNSAGGRLCRKVLAVDPRWYLRAFRRANLCFGRWNQRHAFSNATLLLGSHEGPIILLGAKVCAAFGVAYEPFSVAGRYCVLPHPSGRCLAWNEPGAFARARAAVRQLCPGLPLPE